MATLPLAVVFWSANPQEEPIEEGYGVAKYSQESCVYFMSMFRRRINNRGRGRGGAADKKRQYGVVSGGHRACSKPIREQIVKAMVL